MKTATLITAAMILGAAVPAGLRAAPGEKIADNVDANYKIRPGDLLNISVYPQAELSGTHVAMPDGGVILPTIGHIAVEGLNVKQAESLMEKKLSLYFRNPKVGLTVVQFSRQHIILTGEIRASGLIKHSKGMTLSETIVQAGGFTGNADRKSVRVYRGPLDAQEVKIVDVDAILARGDLSKDFPLEPGDRVEVPRRVNVVFIWGAVNGAGAYDYIVGMKLLDVITRANGIGPYAKLDSVRIFREGGEVFDVDFKSVLDGEMNRDVPLRPGDIIYIPSTALSQATGKLSLFTPWLGLLSLFSTMATLLLLL